MRDSVLPFPLSSQLYNFGKPISSHDEHILSFHNVSGNNSSNSEVQVMPSLDISSFCWDSIAFNDYQLVPPPLAPAGARVNPHRQESLDVTCYDPAFEAAAWYGYSPFSVSDTTSLSESMMMSSNKVTSAGEIENGSHSKRGKKRVIEVSSMATKSTASATTTVGKRKKSSTATASSAEETWHQQLNDQSITIQEFKLQVPVRRSQKLSDKITALQKLVSPYGKTDTASVLQEASLYIKLLQKQIQKLSNMTLSNRISVDHLANKSWKTTIEGSEGELLDLRNRGLCLVPTSLTKKFVDQQCLVFMDPSPNQEEDIAGI